MAMQVDGSAVAVEAGLGVTAVLVLLHRDAPSAQVLTPVGWPSTLAADRSGFGTKRSRAGQRRRFGAKLGEAARRE